MAKSKVLLRRFCRNILNRLNSKSLFSLKNMFSRAWHWLENSTPKEQNKKFLELKFVCLENRFARILAENNRVPLKF